MRLKLNFFLYFLSSSCFSMGFNPLSFENRLINELTNRLGVKLERAPIAESLSHEEIFRRGLKRSLIRYLNDVHSTNFNINDTQFSIKEIFWLYYGRQCKVPIEHLIENVFNPIVASVDLNDFSKDDPIAHFDADRLLESNLRVKNMTLRIIELVKRDQPDDLKLAQQLTAKILHTIQDFYSHTNWVDLGHRNINSAIGSDEFNDMIATQSEEQTIFCLENCEKFEIQCPQLFFTILSNDLKCPLVYYKCMNNTNMSESKLFSGYYSNQKLSDGSSILKPANQGKCSHGGILDATASTISSFGGLNKDSAYYIFSPKAHLHLIAANLAIEHTESYFNFLRSQFGDEMFSKFLRLNPNEDLLNKICNLF